ncbi:MAG: hypothetical protein ABI729_10580, partial [Chitinophagales bacterium]
GVRLQNKSGSQHPGIWNCFLHEWYDVQYFICLPSKFSQNAILKFYLWDPTKSNMIEIDNFSVECWK